MVEKNEIRNFWLARLFKWFCSPDLFDELSGDLEESYYLNSERYGKQKARFIYSLDVLSMIRPSIVKYFTGTSQSGVSMVRQNAVVAIRTLRKDKWYTLINLVGLVIAFTSSIIILQYVNFESSYDAFHEDVSSIYRVQGNISDTETGDLKNARASTLFGLMEAIREEVPDVAHSTHLLPSAGIYTVDQKVFSESKIYFTNADFFEVFSFQMLAGNASSLDEPNSIFLSKSAAHRYFQDEDPIGRSIEFDDGFNAFHYQLRVAGVFEDMPPNSQFDAEFIMNMDDMEKAINENSIFGPNTTTGGCGLALDGLLHVCQIKPRG